MKLFKLPNFLIAVLCVAVAGAASAQEAEGFYYEVDALHPSTLTLPDGFDLHSPRATLRSFSDAVRRYAFKDAATALHSGKATDAERVELARMLSEVMDRQIWLDGGNISDRPDAVIEWVRDNPRAGEAQRSIALGTVNLGRFPVTLRLDRYKAPDQPAVWLFSQESVEKTPALYKLYGPGWVEAKLPRWWRERSVLSVRRWEIAALPLMVLAGVTIGWIISAILQRIRRRMAPGWPRRAVGDARLPLSILAAAIFAQTTINSALGFSGEISSILTPILIAAIVLAIMMTLLRIIDAGLDIVTEHYVGEIDDRLGRDDRQLYTSIYALRRVVTLIAFFAGVGLVLWELGAFRNVGISLLASAGVVTVILGIAGQTVLGNILASLQIAIAKPIRIGDSVNYEGQWAYVEAIFYTFVRLRTWDNRRLMVPVQYFISHPFENWSMTEAKMTQTFYLVLDHTADTGAVRAHFLELSAADEDVLDDEVLKMQVLDHSADGIHCRFYATATDPTTAWDMHARLQEAMLAWVRETHPEWWPQNRVLSASGEAAPTFAPDS